MIDDSFEDENKSKRVNKFGIEKIKELIRNQPQIYFQFHYHFKLTNSNKIHISIIFKIVATFHLLRLCILFYNRM